MNLFIYSSKSKGAANRLQWQIRSCMQGNPTETFNSVAHLSHRLHWPYAKRGETIAVLFAADRQDLANFLSIRDLLEGISIILVLPDNENETIAAGHRLRPRYISYADGNFEDVAAVLIKMEEKFSRDTIRISQGVNYG
jgi:hypothetical protein